MHDLLLNLPSFRRCRQRAWIWRGLVAAASLVAVGDMAAAAHGARALDAVLCVPADVYAGAVAGAGAAADSSHATEAFALARAAVDAGRASDAFRGACRTLAFDPDHADARRLLGFQRVGDTWAGAYSQRMLASGHAWDPRFGWVEAEHLAQFAAGRRPFGGRWISAEEDARRHATIERGWAVRTDHFLVQTNIDRAAGVALAMRLESLYQAWRQLFGELAVSPTELKSRLAGKQSSVPARRPFRVLYHRDRQEYNDALRGRQPQIEITLGIYFDADRQSHFFAGEDQDAGTIAHEAVHQFFYESAPRAARHLATLANAWAVEGAACYFESLATAPAPAADLAPGTQYFQIGAADAGRLPAARHRRMVDNYYVPLAELSSLGMNDLQARTDMARLYSQSAGLAGFFMDYRGGVYRPAFRQLLTAVYAGRDEADTLQKATGRSFAELDAEYLEFMRRLPASGAVAEPTGAPSASGP